MLTCELYRLAPSGNFAQFVNVRVVVGDDAEIIDMMFVRELFDFLD